MPASDWTKDPLFIREYVSTATREGFSPASIDQTRSSLNRYNRWLKSRGYPVLPDAELKEFIAYRAYLLRRPISRTTAQNYLGRIVSFYRLWTQSREGGEEQVEMCNRMQAMGHLWRAYQYESFKPFSPDTLNRILTAAHSYRHIFRKFRSVRSEDYLFLMTLLYTGARAQIYSLRVDEIDFAERVIRTQVKGRKLVTIPLHPKLARLFRHHLAARDYQSAYVFRNARDRNTRLGGECNRANAILICKRVQAVAGLTESVHPHRFRATFATMARSMGMKLEDVQSILGHKNAVTTIGTYIQPEMSDLKRDFAVIDFAPTQKTGGNHTPRSAGLQAPAYLARHQKHAWALIVRGLAGLMGG